MRHSLRVDVSRNRTRIALLLLHESRTRGLGRSILLLARLLCLNLSNRLGNLLFLLLLGERSELGDQAAEGLASLDEVVVRALLDDASVLQEQDVVGLGKDIQVVGDEYSSLVCERAAQKALLDDVLGHASVDGRERVIEEDNVGAKVDGSGKTDSSLLSSTEVDALLSNLGLESVGKNVDIGLESAGL